MTFRPTLRPGAALLRRDATHLQIGTSPGAVLRDHPGLLQALRLIDGVRDVPRLVAVQRQQVPELTIDFAAEIRRLHALGLVIDSSAYASASRYHLGAEGRAHLMHGDDPRALARRRDFTVSIASLPSAPLAEQLSSTLTSVGLTLAHSPPHVAIILSVGEPARALFEPYLQSGVAHLPVTIDEDRVSIGPFVNPGLTPCVGCLDAHRTDIDKAWPVLVEQFGHRVAIATPPAVGPLTSMAAAIAVASEVTSFADHGTCRTNGGVLTVGPSPFEQRLELHPAHPSCACSIFIGAGQTDLS